MLTEIFETKEEEVTGDRRNFCSEEYTLSSILEFDLSCSMLGGRKTCA
jgi:hypothetical protein